MTSTDELLCCPFCGGEANVIDHHNDDGSVSVGCNNDTCLGFSGLGWLYKTEAEAIAAWNTRADYHGYEQAAIEAWESIKAWNTRAERTCDYFSLPEPDGWYKCPDCGCSVGYTELYGGGWSIMMDDYQIPFNNCPNCGKAVKR